jgi:hypothetical protein
MSLGPETPRTGPTHAAVPDTGPAPAAGTALPGTGVPGGPAAGTTLPEAPAAGKHGDPEGLSLGELFAEVSRDLSTLVRQEIELAKAETTASARRAGKGAGMLGGAGYAGHLTILFLSIALWWGLGALVNRGWSAVIVAVIWGIVAAVLASRGRKELKQTPGLEETTDSLKKIPNALQGHEEKNR